MRCPYINPTVEQCFNCSFDDCIKDNQENRDNYNRYRAENLEKERERDRKRYSREKERRNTYNREWYQLHKDERQAYFKEYHKKKREKTIQ